ncbi:SusD/RagB family nutrient-binding outer membrane lipoprotein, partial [Xanthovirga aplysinae]|uniref:SusD/RagB family nutrient-binding outer membrane lipoprotein n=1 Tax=Xanthovirga aplysinae TaxID=2529853 RepID=UPI0012BB67EB
KLKSATLGLGLLGVLTACNFDDYDNVDPKSPLETKSDFLFSNAQKALIDQLNSPSVNIQPARQLVQYWTETTYMESTVWNLNNRDLPGRHWTVLYRDVLTDLQEAKIMLEEEKVGLSEEEYNGKSAMISVLEVYTWQWMVDLFGDVPYTEALMGEENPQPAYDDAQTIYADLINRLNGAIEELNKNSGAYYADADLIYKGSVAEWLKFANSLKLRMGIRLTGVQPATARQLVEEAFANAFTSNEDNATFPYLTGYENGNPIFEQVNTRPTDFVPANTLIDKMNALKDPRRPYYFNLWEETDDDDNVIDSGYKGLAPGISGSIADFSYPSDLMQDVSFPGVYMTYAEVEFILAEAAEYGWNVGGTAEDHYNKAIEASISEWASLAEENADVAINEYLSNPLVNFQTAEGGDHVKAIALQKWIALYNQAPEAYTEYRRLKWPELNTPNNRDMANYPVRFTYPFSEQSRNVNSWREAVDKIGGVDSYTAPIFWETK